MKVISESRLPYPEFPSHIRAGERCYRVLQLDHGLVFEKRDIEKSRLKHEANLLLELSGVRGVPQFQGLTDIDDQGMYGLRTAYVRGQLLSEVATSMSAGELIKVLFRALGTLRAIHRRGVVHGDVRPWNVICDGRSTTLIDFEEGRWFASLPGPIRAYRERKTQREDVHAVLRDVKDLVSTFLYGMSISRSSSARWIGRHSPAVVRKFHLPPPGHNVLAADR